MYVTAAKRTTESMMKTIAAHRQEHLVRLFLKGNLLGGKWLEFGLLRVFLAGRPGSGVPYATEHGPTPFP